MNDSALVRFRERLCRLLAYLDDLFEIERPVGKSLGKRFALDVLHHDVRIASRFAYLINRGDVRVIELRSHARFSQESLLHRFVFDMPRRKHFDCYGAMKLRVVAFKYLAHAACSERAANIESAYVPFRLDERGR